MRNPSRRLGAFTLVELLVVVSLLTTLTALLGPVFARAREQARAAACRSHLRQLGFAVAMYVQDAGGRYPLSTPPRYWPAGLRPYVETAALFQCPSASFHSPYGASYAANSWGYCVARNCPLPPSSPTDAEMEDPSHTAALVDWDGRHPRFPAIVGPETSPLFRAFLTDPETLRHNGMTNTLFYDGHVKPLPPSALADRRLWTRWAD